MLSLILYGESHGRKASKLYRKFIFLLKCSKMGRVYVVWWIRVVDSSSSMAVQPGVGLGLLYNTPPSFRSLALSLYSFIPRFLRSVDTSSNHLIFGRPLRLVAYSFPCIFFFGMAVSCILSM